MGEWKTYKIGEIGTVVTGKTPSSSTPEQFGSVLPFVTPTDFKNYLKSIYGAERLISNLGIAANQRRIIPENSVLVTCIGSDMGKAAINKVACLTNQQINSIVINDRLADNDFIYYAIIDKYELLRTLAHGGSTMPIINKGQFEKIELLLPPIEEQKAIAKILSGFDDKIEVNRRMNATLEEMARALFKAWFVDFEPVHANKENRPSQSASPEIAKLFPSTFENNIPTGWHLGTYSELANLTTGKGLKRAEFVEDGGYPVIGANGIIGRADKYLVDDSLVLTGRVGTLGTVKISKGKAWISDNVLISKPFQYFYYTYLVLESIDLYSLNRGSTQPLVTQTDLKNEIVLRPPNNVLGQFENLAESFFENIMHNDLQNRVLVDIRDTLLPRLISGQSRTPDMNGN